MSENGPDVTETSLAQDLTEEETLALRRYLLFVEYDGSLFRGSQRQPEDIITVQAAVEEAFAEVLKQRVLVDFSSRTDAGVHALAASAHVDIIRRKGKGPAKVVHPEPFEPAVLQSSVNFHLRKLEHACRLTKVYVVPRTVHSRFCAIGRTYIYRIVCPSCLERISCFELNKCWAFSTQLDVAAMRAAAQHFLGRHDFSSFRAAGCSSSSPVREIEELDISEQPAAPAWAPGSRVSSLTNDATRLIVLRVRARSFLYHQIRYMVAWLVAVGTGKRRPEQTRDVLQACKVSALAMNMAPAWGLYLMEVHYPPGLF